MMATLEQHVRERRGDTEAVENGVTVFWLAKHFGLQVSTVRQKLAGCPTVARKTSGHLYALKDAAAYLVKPKMDPETILRSMKAHELPPALQQNFWAAQVQRQKWEREAAELWHTADVLEGFSEVFKRIKFATQLWPDTIERMIGLTDEQRRLLIEQIDRLLDEIFQAIKDMAQEKSTAASVARLDELLSEAEAIEQVIDGDDNSDLI